MVVLNSPFPLAGRKQFRKLLPTGCGSATAFAMIAEDVRFDECPHKTVNSF